MSKNNWKTVHAERFERSDGAVVKYAESPETRPWLKGHRGFIAFAPDNVEGSLYSPVSFARKNTRFRIPHRWKHPERAMKFIDKLYPLESQNKDHAGEEKCSSN